MYLRCATCDHLKSIDDFHKDKSRKTGYCRHCKECVRKMKLYDKYGKKWSIEKKLYKEAIQRSRDKNLPFNIELSDIIIPEFCPLLNVKLSEKRPFCASLDKIIPEKGYVKGNIIVISFLANSMKNNATLEQLSTFCKNAFTVYSLSG